MKDIIKQYEVFAARDGIKFDASMSVGEDLADISGMALVEAYLLDNQVVNDESTLLKKMNLAKFYIPTISLIFIFKFCEFFPSIFIYLRGRLGILIN